MPWVIGAGVFGLLVAVVAGWFTLTQPTAPSPAMASSMLEDMRRKHRRKIDVLDQVRKLGKVRLYADKRMLQQTNPNDPAAEEWWIELPERPTFFFRPETNVISLQFDKDDVLIKVHSFTIPPPAF